MGNNLIPYSIAVGIENIFFFNPHFKLIRRNTYNYDDLLSRNENSYDPFDYHVSNCGIHSFETLRVYENSFKL